MENWIFSKSFDYPSENQLQLIKDKILESSQIEINIEKHLKSILKIVYNFANNPWISQEEIIGQLNVDKSTLKILNEYIRENTYFPILCLVQIAGISFSSLIDPLSNVDMKPVWELLSNKKILKIFHSGRQDIEIFLNITGEIPAPIYDTQIAAIFCGSRYIC